MDPIDKYLEPPVGEPHIRCLACNEYWIPLNTEDPYFEAYEHIKGQHDEVHGKNDLKVFYEDEDYIIDV